MARTPLVPDDMGRHAIPHGVNKLCPDVQCAPGQNIYKQTSARTRIPSAHVFTDGTHPKRSAKLIVASSTPPSSSIITLLNASSYEISVSGWPFPVYATHWANQDHQKVADTKVFTPVPAPYAE